MAVIVVRAVAGVACGITQSIWGMDILWRNVNAYEC